MRHFVFFISIIVTAAAYPSPSVDQVKHTMKIATNFMLEKASYKGGFVWSYLPDFSRQWGELEAKRSMIWMQPPGTASVGHLLLDAYHATQDEYYYNAAKKVAGAIIFAQQKNGGWNYLADYAGEKSLKDWYATIGKNAWRLEEFHHYYGNATFDDGGTAEASKFLLRLYLEKRENQYKKPLYKAIDFVLSSQYPIGGWPQRYPLINNHYSSFITFNDDVSAENIDFLLMCYQTLKEKKLREPILRAMTVFIVTQQGQPQPGWGLQYTTELIPDGARSYEPKSLHAPTTAENIQQLIKFYYLTGDTKFLARIPEAIDWLESLRFPDNREYEGRPYASFIEIDTGRAIFTHRRGSNITNGQYYQNYNPQNMLAHYKSAARLDIPALRQAYKNAINTDPEKTRQTSALNEQLNLSLPKYFTLGKVSFSDLNFRAQAIEESKPVEVKAQQLIDNLNSHGYWPTPLYYTTNPYIGHAPNTKADDQYAKTMVGDQWDTSPYPTDTPVMGISTAAYIKNMGVLIEYLESN